MVLIGRRRETRGIRGYGPGVTDGGRQYSLATASPLRSVDRYGFDLPQRLVRVGRWVSFPAEWMWIASGVRGVGAVVLASAVSPRGVVGFGAITDGR
jgi:hypothetical protein